MICEPIPPRVSSAGAIQPLQEKVWLVQAAAAHVLGVALNDLCAVTRRSPQAALARQVAMYMCHVVFEIGVSHVARAFDRDPSTVAHALRRIEEMREDDEFDRTLSMLEIMLNRAWGDA